MSAGNEDRPEPPLPNGMGETLHDNKLNDATN